MANFPVPLDNLIAYVESMHPVGGPLERVADAFSVSRTLNEEVDALLGHFVDQARKSGATWSEIGAAMGVTKQAAQKRFVPEAPAGAPTFSRFTDRSVRVLLAADRLARSDAGGSGKPAVGATHITAALLTEPEGVAAKAIGAAGLTGEQVCTAVGTGPAAPATNADKSALREMTYGDDGKSVLRGALKAALRLGHNYIGTEHLLLGVVNTGGPAADALADLGLTPEAVLELVNSQIAAYLAERDQSAS